MFNTPLSNVTYDDVLAFCGTFAEGVRSEYKRQPANIPKIISSFANTVGGIWVIGVDTDPANRPVLPPVGFPSAPGIEEQIIQSAQTGVYPAITPDVRVFDIPDQPGRVLAVVKVVESIDAPHAIENSTRVYIRVASTTEPIELADVDRIDYLLKRRKAPEDWRERLVQRAVDMSPMTLGIAPRMRIAIAPVFPRGALFSHDDLYEQASRLDRQAHRVVRNFRLVHEGIMAGQVTDPKQKYHFALSTHGVMLLEELITAAEAFEGIAIVYLLHLALPLVRAIDTAISFFGGSLTNLLIRCQLIHCTGWAFLQSDLRQFIMPGEVVAAQRCLDSDILVSTFTAAETLALRRAELVTEILEQVVWAFSYRAKDLKPKIEHGLRGQNFV